MTSIAVRLEGGIGDCLLGNRFVPAIKELYPDSEITAYIDSEGKTFQKEFLELTYPHFYKEIKVIQKKKYKEFWVDCQFGTDNYYGALENVPDDIRAEMQNFPIFYDLHLDSLKWLDYDFPWLKYFKFFPNSIIKKNTQKVICLNLTSSGSSGHRLEKFYIDGLINKVCDTFPDYEVKAIAMDDTKKFYEGISKPNFYIHIGDIKSVVELIGSSCFVLATDTGFRFFAYSLGIPTLTFSQHCPQPHNPIPSHLIRWLIFPETCYPLNYDYNKIVRTMQSILKDKGTILVPYVENFDVQCVRRVWKINNEKSVLNDN